jgi:hypothetical protein
MQGRLRSSTVTEYLELVPSRSKQLADILCVVANNVSVALDRQGSDGCVNHILRTRLAEQRTRPVCGRFVERDGIAST